MYPLADLAGITCQIDRAHSRLRQTRRYWLMSTSGRLD
jgi:hypothetical protein